MNRNLYLLCVLAAGVNVGIDLYSKNYGSLWGWISATGGWFVAWTSSEA